MCLSKRPFRYLLRWTHTAGSKSSAEGQSEQRLEPKVLRAFFKPVTVVVDVLWAICRQLMNHRLVL